MPSSSHDPSGSNRNLSLYELSKVIESSEGWIVEQQLKLLDASVEIFAANYRELKQVLDAFGKPELAMKILQRQDRDAVMRAGQIETLRRFHNFLASATTLVHHSRRTANRLYANLPFIAEYSARVEQDFRDSPLTQFIHRLRNYFLHQTLPPLAAHIEFGDTITSSMTLDTADLRRWREWNHQSRIYLESADDELNLADVVEAYKNHVEQFHKWFVKRQLQVHSQAFAELRRLRKRYKRLLDAFYAALETQRAEHTHESPPLAGN